MRISGMVVERKGGPFVLQDLELAPPRPTELLVRVVAAGICATDLHLRDQDYPMPLPIVLGHEGAGVVEAVGDGVDGIVPGDHVVMSYPSCQRCAHCRRGMNAYCFDSFRLCFGGARSDGSSALRRVAFSGDEMVHGHVFAQSSFATYAIADRSNVVPVPKDLPLDRLAPLGCGLQTGAGAVLNTLNGGPDYRLAVFGTGTVGLAAVMAARITGARRIVAVDVNPDRLALAAALGATDVLDARDGNLHERLRALEPGGFNGILEATARPDMLSLAVRSLAPLGTAALVGGAPAGTTAAIDMNVLLEGRTVRGIVQGSAVPQIIIPRLIALHREGRFPFERLLSFYPFSEIETAIADMKKGRAIKPVLRIADAVDTPATSGE